MHPSLSTESPCPEKLLSPGKTEIVGYFSAVPEGLDEFEALTCVEQSVTCKGKGLAKVTGKGRECVHANLC